MRRFDLSEASRFAQFVVVGGSNTIIALVIFSIALALGVPYLVAAALGYAIGIVNGYTWNRLWTFTSGQPDRAELYRYIVVSVGGLVANAVGLLLAMQALSIGKVWAEVASLGVITLGTFLINRRWTFRQPGVRQL